MKKFTLSVIALAVFSAAFGQKVQDEEVAFKETRIPMSPLGSALQHYQFTVKTSYPENNNAVVEQAQIKYEQDVANYPQVVEESKAKYERDLVEYDAQVEMARENFKIESEQYNNLSMVERMALADQKPTLKLPSKPVYYKPAEPRYVEPNLSRSITFSPEALSGTYLKLDGFTKGTENALIGTVTLYDFEFLDPKQNVVEKNVYNSQTKQTTVQRTYTYTTSYKRPTYLALVFNGTSVFDGIVESTAEFTEMTTQQSPNMFNLEKQTVVDALVAVNEFVNSNYGFTTIEKTIKIGFIKNKDGAYDDLEQAKNSAIAGLKKLKYGEQNDDIESAIATWEKVLDDTDLSDKKARIDDSAYEEILFNLCKVYLATYQVGKAQAKIEALKGMKLNNSEKQMLEGFEAEAQDKALRLAAN